MIKKEKDSLCVNCPSLGLECQGSTCPYRERDLYWRECDKCGETDEMIYDVNGKELCEKCAFDELANFNNMLKYVESDRQRKVEFYFDFVCGSKLFFDYEKVSDKVIEIVRKECLEFPNMIYDDLKSYCEDDKMNFVEFFCKPCGEIEVEEEEW